MTQSEVFAPGLLAGKVALVTGGGTNLGLAAAAELERCGAKVMISGRREEVLAAAAAVIGDDGCEWCAADVRSPDECERLVGETVARLGGLDVLLSSAGGQYFSPAEAIDDKGFAAVMRLNVGASLLMAEAAAAVMATSAGGAGGTIINTTLSPHHGLQGMAHSSAARAAVEALTLELADRWAAEGIAVCCVAPGHMDTTSLRKYPKEVQRQGARSVPLGRLGRMDEHGWLVALLASDLGKALSGSVVTLDGARDNWYGPWPPEVLKDEQGEVPQEERRDAPVT